MFYKTKEHFRELYRIGKEQGLLKAVGYDLIKTLDDIEKVFDIMDEIEQSGERAEMHCARLESRFCPNRIGTASDLELMRGNP